MTEWISAGDGTHYKVCEHDAKHVIVENCRGGIATEEKLATCSVCRGSYGDYRAPSEKPSTPDTDIDTPDEISPQSCEHMCHTTNIFERIIWSFINFFNQLFGLNPVCPCGTKHY